MVFGDENVFEKRVRQEPLTDVVFPGPSSHGLPVRCELVRTRLGGEGSRLVRNFSTPTSLVGSDVL